MNKLERLSYHVNDIQNYLNNNLTNVQIAEIFNCRANDIYIICKRFNLTKKYRVEHPNVQLDYFKCIDTNEKAYWLGFLYADGYISKEGKSVLSLSVKDYEHVKKFALAIGADINKIKIRNHNNVCHSISCSITVSKKEFSEHLIKHGCINKKSLIIRFPFNSLTSEELKLSFLMGYYDGDGMTNSSTICCGSKEFLNDIKNYFNINYQIKKRKYNIELYELTLGMDLKEKMTDSYCFGLERKQGKLKYKYNKNLVHYNKRNQEQKRKFSITKEALNNLINIKKLSYRTIGKMFNVCDNSIKKRAMLLGINLPIRNSRNKNKVD